MSEPEHCDGDGCWPPHGPAPTPYVYDGFTPVDDSEVVIVDDTGEHEACGCGGESGELGSLVEDYDDDSEANPLGEVVEEISGGDEE